MVMRLSSTNGELVKHDVELGLVIFDLTLVLAYDPVATPNRVTSSDIGLENDGVHRSVFVGLVKVLDDFGNVAHAKQFMSVEELALAVVREIRGENAVRSAFPTLVLARSASLCVAVSFGGSTNGGIRWSNNIISTGIIVVVVVVKGHG